VAGALPFIKKKVRIEPLAWVRSTPTDQCSPSRFSFFFRLRSSLLWLLDSGRWLTALSWAPCIRPRTAHSAAVAPASRRRAVFGGHLLGGQGRGWMEGWVLALCLNEKAVAHPSTSSSPLFSHGSSGSQFPAEHWSSSGRSVPLWGIYLPCSWSGPHGILSSCLGWEMQVSGF
jgi:hypothetical protein